VKLKANNGVQQKLNFMGVDELLKAFGKEGESLVIQS